MRRLGLDIGSVRVGVAVSDPLGRVAMPSKTLDGRTLLSDPEPLLRLIDEYEVQEIVIGLPLSLDGTEGPQAQEVRRIADSLTQVLPCPTVFHDERFTTAQADRTLIANGMTSRERRKARDAAAATILLQSFLDAHRSDGEGTCDGG